MRNPEFLRSKQDSEHIKVEIGLLKTFIMESYNNLTELRCAEQAVEVEAKDQPFPATTAHPGIHDSHAQDSAIPANAPLVPRSPSPVSSDRKSEDENSSDDDDEDDNEVDSTKATNEDDENDVGRARNHLRAGGTVSRSSPYAIASPPTSHQQSNLLLSMMPYRPRSRDSVGSGRLILARQGSASDPGSVTQTESVRKLLDKWTTSGSAAISNILDEEAANEKSEA